MGKTINKVGTGFYLDKELMARARAIARDLGVPLTRLASVGLLQQVERYEKMKAVDDKAKKQC